jgi:hypothetical protein
MPTLPGAMLEFLAAVDEAMVVLKSSHIGKIAEISAYIRDVYAWRRSPPALLLVDKLVEAVEGLSAGDIGGERGFGPGPGRFAGEGSARIYHPNLVEALHLTLVQFSYLQVTTSAPFSRFTLGGVSSGIRGRHRRRARRARRRKNY